jgi:hypothetical protein
VTHVFNFMGIDHGFTPPSCGGILSVLLHLQGFHLPAFLNAA